MENITPVPWDVIFYACGKYFPHVGFKIHMWSWIIFVFINDEIFRLRNLYFLHVYFIFRIMWIFFNACEILNSRTWNPHFGCNTLRMWKIFSACDFQKSHVELNWFRTKSHTKSRCLHHCKVKNIFVTMSQTSPCTPVFIKKFICVFYFPHAEFK